jgi:hypothetical protein
LEAVAQCSAQRADKTFRLTLSRKIGDVQASNGVDTLLDGASGATVLKRIPRVTVAHRKTQRCRQSG